MPQTVRSHMLYTDLVRSHQQLQIINSCACRQQCCLSYSFLFCSSYSCRSYVICTFIGHFSYRYS